MKKTDEKPKTLSLEETAELLGADALQEVDPVRLDPIGMQVLATKVARRMATRRGRPTDQSWDLVRKIPMKTTTWEYLKELAARLSSEVRVAPGQMGAIALELGVSRIRFESSRTIRAVITGTDPVSFVCHEESEEEAKILCPVVAEGVW